MSAHRPPTNEELEICARSCGAVDFPLAMRMATEIQRLRKVCKREVYVLQGFLLVSDFDSHLRDEITARLRAASEGK